ncbi:MAG: hypothetical protein ABI315_06425 [Bacteroidia bacterium]
MEQFNNLSQQEKSMLLKFPAWISLLATNSDTEIDKTEMKEALHFTHIKTFSCDPLLTDFYKEAEKVFISNIVELDKSLPKGREERKFVISKELKKLEPILDKLGKEFALIMHKSMQSYINHVSKARNNVLESFVIPLYIKGLTG